MKTLRTFKIRFSHNGLSGPRVFILDTHYHERRVIPYCHDSGNTLETAIRFFKSIDLDLIGSSILPDCYLVISENLEKRIKK